MDPNPFAVLSLIVAPAILTNASSVLIMSTSNRLARGADRARELSKQLEGTEDLSTVGMKGDAANTVRHSDRIAKQGSGTERI